MPADPKTIESILETVALGKSLRVACEDHGVAHTSFLRWVDNDATLAEHYARAREAQARLWADEIITLADAEGVDPQRSRLQVDTRKWLLSKVLPKIYGDRLQIDHQHSGQIQVVASSLPAPDAVSAYLAQVRGELPEPDAVDVDVVPVGDSGSDAADLDDSAHEKRSKGEDA